MVLLRPGGAVRKKLSHCPGFVPLFYNDVYDVPLPANHRFPMKKYKMVREKVQREFRNDPRVIFYESPLVSRDDLLTTHCPRYIDKYLQGAMTPEEIRQTGLPWSIESVKRTLSSVGGTVAASRALFLPSSCEFNPRVVFSGHFAGGTHHAFRDKGEGFCIFNDIATAANVTLRDFPTTVKKILILDLDVHQGNGTAKLFHSKNNVFTFSMHCVQNFFSDKEKSDLDIELKEGLNDDIYLDTLKAWLPRLFSTIKPELVFFQAGIDILKFDRLGRLQITREGIRARNSLVYRCVIENDARCVVTMGGGYPRNLDSNSHEFNEIVECHADVYRGLIQHAHGI